MMNMLTVYLSYLLKIYRCEDLSRQIAVCSLILRHSAFFELYAATMALNLLLETYAEVTSLKTIESADIFESRRITVVLLPHSVVLINVRTIDLVSAKLASFIGATQEYSQELKYSIHLFFDSLG